MAKPRFLTVEEVKALHRMQIEQFGGSHGLRDEELLKSALAQPRQGAFGQYFHPSLGSMAAAYLYHIVKNHPFIDGNKRTGFAAADTFLGLNGYDLADSQEHFDMVSCVANGQMNKDEIALHLNNFVEPMDVPEIL